MLQKTRGDVGGSELRTSIGSVVRSHSRQQKNKDKAASPDKHLTALCDYAGAKTHAPPAGGRRGKVEWLAHAYATCAVMGQLDTKSKKGTQFSRQLGTERVPGAAAGAAAGACVGYRCGFTS